MLSAALLSGCFSAPPRSITRVAQRAPSYSRTHVVAPGETVYHIAVEYGVSPERLMAVNGIGNPTELRVGQVLTIPGTAVATASAAPFPDPWDVAPADRQFAWPITAGVVSSPFGVRHGVMHDGIDIDAAAGTPVRAADAGVVIYAGHMRGYGNVVLVQHSEGYVTVYAHNRRNLTRAGDHVVRGQEIAELGATGRASGPNLHFEVRHDNRAENPLAYLPPPTATRGITFARNGGS